MSEFYETIITDSGVTISYINNHDNFDKNAGRSSNHFKHNSDHLTAHNQFSDNPLSEEASKYKLSVNARILFPSHHYSVDRSSRREKILPYPNKYVRWTDLPVMEYFYHYSCYPNEKIKDEFKTDYLVDFGPKPCVTCGHVKESDGRKHRYDNLTSCPEYTNVVIVHISFGLNNTHADFLIGEHQLPKGEVDVSKLQPGNYSSKYTLGELVSYTYYKTEIIHFGELVFDDIVWRNDSRFPRGVCDWYLVVIRLDSDDVTMCKKFKCVVPGEYYRLGVKESKLGIFRILREKCGDENREEIRDAKISRSEDESGVLARVEYGIKLPMYGGPMINGCWFE